MSVVLNERACSESNALAHVAQALVVQDDRDIVGNPQERPDNVLVRAVNGLHRSCNTPTVHWTPCAS